MLRRAGSCLTGLLLVFGLSGCPVTDDYFIDSGGASSDAGAWGGSSAGLAAGGRAQGGSAPRAGEAGMPPTAGMPTMAGPDCVPATERCNGHDDNCNDVVDEQACNSGDNGTTGCAGFVIGMQPNHGYMLCTTTQDYAGAQLACQQQSMRLAWLETRGENDKVTAKAKALTSDEIWFGASDAAEEGAWSWDGPEGQQFWQGNEDGRTVNNGYAAWMSGTPNDDNSGEDCAVLNAMTGLWGDRSCTTRYAYLCEEPE